MRNLRRFDGPKDRCSNDDHAQHRERTRLFTCRPARRSRPELFDSAFRFDAIPIRAKTGIDTALVWRTGTSTKPAAATYKQTHRQTAKQQGEAAGQLSRAGKHVNAPIVIVRRYGELSKFSASKIRIPAISIVISFQLQVGDYNGRGRRRHANFQKFVSAVRCLPRASVEAVIPFPWRRNLLVFILIVPFCANINSLFHLRCR